MTSLENLKRRVARLEGPRSDRAVDRLADLREQIAGIVPAIRAASSPMAALREYDRGYALLERMDAINRASPRPPVPTMTASEARVAYDRWMREIGGTP